MSSIPLTEKVGHHMMSLSLKDSTFLLTTPSKTKVNLRSQRKEVLEPETLSVMKNIVITMQRTAMTTRAITRKARKLKKKRERGREGERERERERGRERVREAMAMTLPSVKKRSNSSNL